MWMGRSLSRGGVGGSVVAEPLEGRRMMAVTYAVQAATGNAPYTTWANNWTATFKQTTNNYTGSDGIYSIPLNGNDKLGSAYATSGWQQWTTGDAFLGSYNATTGARSSGTKFVNNVASIQNTSGQTPAAQNFKWRGSIGSTAQEQMAIVPRKANGEYYWPSDGVRIGNQVIQFALRMSGQNLAGVSKITANVPGTISTSNWPLANTSNFTVNDAAPNLVWPDNSTTDPFNVYSGERTAAAALLDLRNTTVAYQSTGYIYMYGTQNGSGLFEKYVFVARAPASTFADTSTWQYWSDINGTGAGTWTGNFAGTDAIGWATPLKQGTGGSAANIKDMGSEFSVFQMPDGRLAMLYPQNDAFGGGRIAVRYAPAGHPEGPWSAPTVVYTISTPDTGNSAIGLRAIPSGFSGFHYWTYGMKVHPQLSKAPTGAGSSKAGKLLVSFHTSTYWGGSGSAPTLGPEFAYGDIYRPRFLELSLLGTETAGARAAQMKGPAVMVKAAVPAASEAFSAVPVASVMVSPWDLQDAESIFL